MRCTTVVPRQELVKRLCVWTFIGDKAIVTDAGSCSTALNLHVDVMECDELTVMSHIIQ